MEKEYRMKRPVRGGGTRSFGLGVSVRGKSVMQELTFRGGLGEFDKQKKITRK